MKIYSLLFSLVFSTYIFAQVGVGTTTPDPSSILDVTATDKGVLVPRVSLTDVTNATTPINIPATGLLVWNTNAAVTGGNGIGFYFFNGVQWVAIQQAQVDDADFYEEGTTTAPNDITDDMYTQGNIGIGKVTADYKLDIAEDTGLKAVDITVTGDIDGNRIAIDNNISGTQNPGIGNQIWGLRNTIFSGGGFAIFGIENRVSGNYSSQKYGVANIISGGTGNHYGTYNTMSSSDATSGNLRFGVWNVLEYNAPSNSGLEAGVYNSMLGTSTSSKYGVFNDLEGSGTGNKYGSYNQIDIAAGGTHYGVYSRVLKSGSFAGYFLGDVSIGTTVGNSYVMPDSDGTSGQVMQTDGVGNVDWVDKNDNSALSLVRVNLSGTYNQSATGANWVNIDFDNEIFDTNGEFNTATNTFTAASAGYYRVNSSYHTTAQSNTGYFGIAVYVNGTLYAESTHNHHNVGDVMRQVDCLVVLAVSDTVEVRIRAESNAVDIDGFGGKTFMEIEQIKRN
ncbi:MAG: hypothetical protein KDD03_10055 [Gelidibacter sp.]|nr:hypothetical protein [Gelidibacter sp.]